jgi:hypothetical protein
MIALKKSATPGTVSGVAAGSNVASPERSAAAEPSPRGNICSSSGISNAPRIAELVQTITNQMIARPAIRPARAASAPAAIPITSRAMIRGMTVILSAFSQRPPIIVAALSAPSRKPSPKVLAAIPASSPATSPSSTQ